MKKILGENGMLIQKWLSRKIDNSTLYNNKIIYDCSKRWCKRHLVLKGTVLSFTLQFVQFTRSYNTTPSVHISANHSTAASGNLPLIHNGIATWIEVRNSVLSRSYRIPCLIRLQLPVSCYHRLQ